MGTSPCNDSNFCYLLCSIGKEHTHKGESQNHNWKGHLIYGLNSNRSTCYTTYGLKSEPAHKCAAFRRFRKIAG